MSGTNPGIHRAVELLKEYKEQSDNACKAQLAVWRKERIDKIPLLLTRTLSPEVQSFLPKRNTKEIHFDSEKMLEEQLSLALGCVIAQSGAVPSVRANMGCGIFPTLFGISQNLYEDKMPWVREHLPKERLQKMGPEDIKLSDEFKAGLEHMAYMAQELKDTGCFVYPMDVQGAFDMAHIVLGDDIFYEIYDDPDFVHHLLELCCHAIFMGMEECLKVMPRSNEYIAHYNGMIMPAEYGGIKLSEDTSTLLSKDTIQEFVTPYMEKILEHFHGGYVHYCGRNDHLFKEVMSLKLAHGLNLGQPEKHDMDEVLRRCAQADKVYYGFANQKEQEPLRDYFSRCLKNSYSEETNQPRILLQYQCSYNEAEAVLRLWNQLQI